MNPVLRNILAILAGLVFGSAVNMGLIMIGPKIIPLPAGYEAMDMESLKASFHLLELRHFIFPFLAHAIGTLAGAIVASLIAASHKMKIALGIGAAFLLGGISTVFMIPAPIWFTALDLIGAYIPMGWLGGKITEKRFSD